MSLKINFLGKEFKNPIIPASGTFGFGYEFNNLYDINHVQLVHHISMCRMCQ